MAKPRSTTELFHRYANGYRDSVTVGNVSIGAPRLYSYQLAICTELKGTYVLHGLPVSSTTNRHISVLGQTLRHQRVIHVPDIGSVRSSQAFLTGLIERSLAEASVARTRKEAILARLADKLLDFNTFAELSDSDMRFNVEEVIGRDLKEIAVTQKAEAKRQNELKKAQLAQSKASMEENLELWRKGAPSFWKLRDLPPALRLRKELVETSHGASITVDEARNLWPVVQRALRTHNDYTVGMAIGHYRLTKITAQGDLVIGCHSIAHSEVERIAKELELT